MDNYYYKYIKYKKKYINYKESNINMTGGGKCQKNTLKKYEKRPSPPFPANDCQGQKKKGNNGKMYESVSDKNNVYKWIIVKDIKKEDNMKGTVDDFINLFQNIDFNLTINPKTLKKTKEYLKTIFKLPKTFIFDKKVKQIIADEESYGNFNKIKLNVKGNKVNILDFLHSIYSYFKKDIESRDHIFLEEFTGYLTDDTIYISLRFGS